MTAYILDTETNGVDEPHATEIAYVGVEFSADEQILTLIDGSSFEQRFNPEKPITLGSQAITRIFDEDVADKPPHTTFNLPTDCQYLIGHNIDFDCGVLVNAQCDLNQIKRICTLALAKHFYPDIENHQLGTLLCAFHQSIAKKNLKNAHGARFDVWFTYLILRTICIEQNIKSMEQLHQISEQARIPTVITFGKYKGTKIAELPQDYVSWLFKQDNLDPYLKIALEKR